MPYCKISAGIVNSTIWSEDYATRIVWISLLALKNQDGFVEGSIGGLARICNVQRAEFENAIKILSSEDPDSKTSEHGGRRIEIVEGGYFIINHEKYRDMKSDSPAALRQRKYREKIEAEKNVTSCDMSRPVTGTVYVSESVSVSGSLKETSDVPQNEDETQPEATEHDGETELEPQNPAKRDETALWRQKTSEGYAEYIRIAEAEFDRLYDDWAWVARMKLYYPGVSIRLTLEKMWEQYWGTEAGWINKRQKRSNKMNWQRTIESNFPKSRVYFERNRPDTELQHIEELKRQGKLQ